VALFGAISYSTRARDAHSPDNSLETLSISPLQVRASVNFVGICVSVGMMPTSSLFAHEHTLRPFSIISFVVRRCGNLWFSCRFPDRLSTSALRKRPIIGRTKRDNLFPAL